MTTYLGKSCSFCLPRVPFVNCRQFMYLVISILVSRAGYGIWLYQFLIIAYLFTFNIIPERLLLTRFNPHPDHWLLWYCLYRTSKTVFPPFVSLSCTLNTSEYLSHLSRLMTKPTKWHKRPATTQISLCTRLQALKDLWAWVLQLAECSFESVTNICY